MSTAVAGTAGIGKLPSKPLSEVMMCCGIAGALTFFLVRSVESRLSYAVVCENMTGPAPGLSSAADSRSLCRVPLEFSKR